VLARRQQPVPAGSPSELWTGGAGLPRGYFGRPALTAERCVPDPWSGEPGARLHRAGDRVRRRPDGAIENLGGAAEEVGSAVTIAYATFTE
jgi:non-ribosomal peptide synthetase component F